MVIEFTYFTLVVSGITIVITFFFKYEPSMALGQRTGATVNDLRKLNAMYNCNGAGANTNTNTGEYQGNTFHIF